MQSRGRVPVAMPVPARKQKNFTKLPRTTLGTGLARTGTKQKKRGSRERGPPQG